MTGVEIGGDVPEAKKATKWDVQDIYDTNECDDKAYVLDFMSEDNGASYIVDIGLSDYFGLLASSKDYPVEERLQDCCEQIGCVKEYMGYGFGENKMSIRMSYQSFILFIANKRDGHITNIISQKLFEVTMDDRDGLKKLMQPSF